MMWFGFGCRGFLSSFLCDSACPPPVPPPADLEWDIFARWRSDDRGQPLQPHSTGHRPLLQCVVLRVCGSLMNLRPGDAPLARPPLHAGESPGYGTVGSPAGIESASIVGYTVAMTVTLSGSSSAGLVDAASALTAALAAACSVPQESVSAVATARPKERATQQSVASEDAAAAAGGGAYYYATFDVELSVPTASRATAVMALLQSNAAAAGGGSAQTQLQAAASLAISEETQPAASAVVSVELSGTSAYSRHHDILLLRPSPLI